MNARAQSEVVGSVLVIGVVVLTVGVAGATVLDAVTSTTDPPRAEVSGSVTTDAIQLTHGGGASIPGSELRLLVRVNGSETSVSWDDGTLSGGDDAFDPGEQWRVDRAYGGGSVVTVSLIHTPSNAVLFETETNPRRPRVAAGDGGLAGATDREGGIDPGDVGGGSDTPEPPDGEPAPPSGDAFNDLDGDGLYDEGEGTYSETELYEFDDESVDLVIPSDVGTLDRRNEDIDIRAKSITTSADISADNAALSLTATDGDIDVSGTSLSSRNNPIDIEASGTVDATGADVSADNAATTIRASRILVSNGRITSRNNPITLESTGGDGEIVADGATIAADNAGVTLTTSDGRDLSIRGATITSRNNPILVDSAGELDATDATVTADNSRVTLRSGGGDPLSIRNADVDSRNNPITVDSADELDATGASLTADNGNIGTVSRGDAFFDEATLTARSVTADLGGPYTIHVDGTTVNDDDDRIAYTPTDATEDPSGSNAATPA